MWVSELSGVENDLARKETDFHFVGLEPFCCTPKSYLSSIVTVVMEKEILLRTLPMRISSQKVEQN